MIVLGLASFNRMRRLNAEKEVQEKVNQKKKMKKETKKTEKKK